MDGSPQLLTDVKFTQLKRGGYDPDQVDNFLERVSAAVAQLQDKLRVATERAESADAQIAEARRLQAEAEAAAERAGAVPAAGGAADETGANEELTRVLVLAQRAADQAVEEANTTATRTLADARAKAVNLVAEAEQERDHMLAKARKKADAAVEERTHELQERVALLETARDALAADVDALQDYLDHARAELQERIESVRKVVDDPRGFRLAPAPELSQTTIPVDDLDADDADDLDDPDPGPPHGSGPDGGGGGGEPVTGGGPSSSIDDANDDDEATEPGASTDDDESDASRATLVVDGPVTGSTVPADESSFDESGIDDGSAAGPAASDDAIDLTSQRLFGPVDAEAEATALDSGAPTEMFTPSYDGAAPEPVSDAAPDSPLGEPDEAADAAMRAFFDADLESASEPPKPRFGRRR